MQLGISTYTFPWAFGVPGYAPEKPMTLFELLQKAQKHDIKVIQIGDNVPLCQLPPDECLAFFSAAKSMQIQLEIGTRRLTTEHLEAYLYLAHTAGSRFLRVVIDDADYHPGAEEVIKTLNYLLPLAKELKVIIAIENHDRFPALLLKNIIQATDEYYVGICLDTANSLGADEGIKEIVSILKDYTVNVHIKDYQISRLPHKMGFLVEGRPAGAGMLDIKWLVEALHDNTRCKTATLEIWSNPLETLEKTLQQEQEWAEQSIKFLKSIII